ncbi:MAG: TetR/AcrR family transcriptional regulator [Pseudomonadota bacterium]|nr:TetR/AcrR family transcriptional regulator [Pseudomonadota bacterium]
MVKVKTSQKILSCAIRMFAQHGYGGTIMDELAEQCGVNKASIYYHHKDKATLYESALIALFTPIADAVIEAVKSESTPVGKLERHIKEFAIANAEHPDFAAILMREMASGGANMPVRAREQMQRILFLLREILQKGESQNIFKSSDPLIIHFMIVGTINLFVASIPLRNSLPEKGQLNNRDIESAYEQVTETILSSLIIK